MKNNRRNKITHQVMIPLIIFQTILLLLTITPVILINWNRLLTANISVTQEVAVHAAAELHDYRCINDLARYMHEHTDEIERIYDPDIIFEKETELNDLFDGYYSKKRVTPEQFAEMTDYEKKLFAEVCYFEISNTLDRIKMNFEIEFLSAFIYDNGKLFIIASGRKDDERYVSQGGDVYELGVVVPGDVGDRPLLDAMASGEINEFDTDTAYDLSLNGQEINTYFPLLDKSGARMLFVGTTDMRGQLEEESVFNAISIGIVIIAFVLIEILHIRYLILKVVVRPIQKERDILNEYTRAKDPETVNAALSEIKSDNEIQTLAENFSHMASELDQYTKQLLSVTTEKERIGAELDTARGIQASQLPNMFPLFPDRGEFDVFASMTPAKEVGGDFYDLFMADSDHLALVMADVSDKGVPAALFMMRAKTVIKLLTQPGASPAQVLYKANAAIAENNDELMFITVWLGILEISTGRLTYSDAGHEKPAVFRNGRWELLEKDTIGPALGMFEPQELDDIPSGDGYKDRCIILSPGDMLFQYTDGVTEAANARRELFGEKRLLEALKDGGTNDPEKLLHHIRSRIDGFAGEAPQSDDITMLALRYNGTENYPGSTAKTG